MFLEENITGLCEKYGLDKDEFLDELEVDHVKDLSMYDLEAIAEEYETDVFSLIFKRVFAKSALKSKLEKIKLLVLDVDGVMTDGGMYFTESGDQFKKFNTKDGMAIIHLTRNNFQVAIISSGFKGDAVQRRAEMLGIQHCTVNREPKMDRLRTVCDNLKIEFENVAMIGDDINDLQVMKACGFAACPKDAVQAIKNEVDLVLSLKGGEGCIREFIDYYILNEPLNHYDK